MSWFIDFPNEVFPFILQDLKEGFVVSLFWTPFVLFVFILVRVIIYFFKWLVSKFKSKTKGV